MNSLYYHIIIFSLSSLLGYTQNTQSSQSKKLLQEEVKATITTFFEGFHSADTTKIYTSIDKSMILQTIIPDTKGGRTITMSNVKMFVLAIHNKQQSENWKEELLDFKIEATDAIAHVWTPYNFYLNDRLSHCGVNSFQLYNNGTAWKITAIADTRNTEGCIVTTN
ncbi:nuclear transport factor 2 family protein [Aquimarina sp. W85]|uniref:nuclear transport factor 2 family protein n=1 Tax=Aquimarina rhodophyticola TaxID=3342246 RepID=UPI00366A84EA